MTERKLSLRGITADVDRGFKRAVPKYAGESAGTQPPRARRTCKEEALLRIYATNLAERLSNTPPSRCLSEARARSRRTDRSDATRKKRTNSAALNSPVRRLRALSISQTPSNQRKIRAPAPAKLPSSNDSDDDFQPSDSQSSSSPENYSSTSESDSDSTTSEPSSDGWTNKRQSVKSKRTSFRTPVSRRIPRLTEASSTSRVPLIHKAFIPKRTMSVQPNRTLTTLKADHSKSGCLPGREHEFDSIYTFVTTHLYERTGGCIYISGLPGTGKTASVNAVLAYLSNSSGHHPTFRRISVNGMQVNDPKQVYVHIYQQLTGRILTAKHAAEQLEREFCAPAGVRRQHVFRSLCPSSNADSLEAVVLVVDELDLLCTRRQDVLYNLFDWPTRPRCVRPVIVLAIANTMDLPERLLHPRVASRLGLTRLTFAPYSHEQLVSIVRSHLNESVSNTFQEKALELASRKVAAVSGDVRRALDICRRAVEIVATADQSKSTKQEIRIEHINAALKEMFTTPKLTAIRSCSIYEKLFLRSLVSEFEARNSEEARLERCINQMCALCRLEGVPCPTTSEVFSICSSLGAHKLLLTEPSRKDTAMLVRLNCTKSDVLFALKPPPA
ncbi:unnamed protein product [Calicophoron daubneyi]|uniref:Origin recognition complex subunit 1 n=1 Tax=Calicophoron daubneyi TaxID=300641 RepID=A0AAV2TU19_CALDB